MNCIEFKSAMERAVELREPVASTALEHTLTCATCRSAWELQRQLDAAITAWRETLPPAGFTESVLAELKRPAGTEDSDCRDLFADIEYIALARSTIFDQQTPAIEPTIRRTIRSASLALISPVACLFVLIVLVSFLSAKRSQQPLDDMVSAALSQSGKFTPESPPLDVSMTISDLLTELRSEYNDIASETTSAAIDVVSAIPPRMPASVSDDSKETESPQNHDSVTPNWHPISGRVRIAMAFLWKAVPSDGRSD